MKKEILEMVETYELSLISPTCFLNQFSDLLAYLGSADDLDERMNNLLSPLAKFVATKLKEGNHFSFYEFDKLNK